jgi:hypothetical protein
VHPDADEALVVEPAQVEPCCVDVILVEVNLNAGVVPVPREPVEPAIDIAVVAS